MTAAAAPAAAAALPAAALAHDEDDNHHEKKHQHLGGPIHKIVELTHTMDETFPTYDGGQNLIIEVLATFETDFFNMKRWLLVEHTGTHMDAPIHFSADQDTADEIPVEKLVCPLAVVDIRRKARRNPDAQVTVRDLRRWERRYGRIPKGACVAMYSGWEKRLGTPGAFRNADSDGVMHFPGFHVDAVEFLLERRDANGIAVDTLSLDYGPSADFATHYLWLGNNKWGMENVANLGKMPPRGGTFIAGGPKIAGATGGPSRCIGFVHKHDD